MDWTQAAEWVPAQAASRVPRGALRPLSMPAARVLRTLKPVNVSKLANGNLRFDFPENFVGVVQLKLASKPAAGTVITVKHGEVTLDDGTVSFPWHETYQ